MNDHITRILKIGCNNGQIKNINVGFSKFPIGLIQSKMFWSLEIEQTSGETCNDRFIQMNVLEEMLQRAIIGRVKCIAGELTCQM